MENRREFIRKLPLLFTFPHLTLTDKDNYPAILKKLPKSRAHLPIIYDGRITYKSIFDIPLEILAYHIYFESRFNPNAFSPRLAIGISQFKREKAEEVGMKVYDSKKYSSLYSLEQKIEENYAELSLLKSGDEKKGIKGYRELVEIDEFKEAQRLKLIYNKLKAKNNKLVEEFKREFFKYASDKSFDGRTDPNISLDRCCYWLATLGKLAEERFPGKKEYNIQRALICYNYGLAALDDYGFPVATEPIRHMRKVIAYADRINSS